MKWLSEQLNCFRWRAGEQPEKLCFVTTLLMLGSTMPKIIIAITVLIGIKYQYFCLFITNGLDRKDISSVDSANECPVPFL